MVWIRIISSLLLLCYLHSQQIQAQNSAKERVFVLTDISNEPDDEESLVRFLVYSNEFDIEGLVATTSTWLHSNPREDLIRRQIYAYGLVRDNLEKHKPGFPTKEALLARVATGQTEYGMDGVGDTLTTVGSRLLEEAIDQSDSRPLWISIWGGANTLAQTLYDVRKERSAEELEKFIRKFKVYTISDQDDSGPWIRREFPDIFYIVSPSAPDWKEYYRATWTGISGDRQYKNGPRYAFDLVDNPWLKENIMNHGPLGSLYPPLTYIMEGDTPSFLGLINNGLGWSVNPAYGGWGGRYDLFQAYGETRPIWTDTQRSIDCVTVDNKMHCSNQASIWRWRKDYQHDFAARMDWCTQTEYASANHNPVVKINDDESKEILELTAKPGELVKLTAEGSTDPDGNALNFQFAIYPEASTEGTVATMEHADAAVAVLTIAENSEVGDIHVVLTVEDNGTPSLVSYRRAIIHIVN
ncbi:MAG: DUF1593 domain-containing protein [Saprospiraceae bacterium]|nr:DUF1593 domain-containing protein [Saprospiraceae bacterium]